MNTSDKMNGYLNQVDEELMPASLKEFVRSKTQKFQNVYADVTNLIAADSYEKYQEVKNNLNTDPDLGIPLNSVNIDLNVDGDHAIHETNQTFIRFGDLVDKLESDLVNISQDIVDKDYIPASGITVDGDLVSREYASIDVDEVMKALSDGIQELNAQEAVMNTLDECDPEDNSVSTSDFMSKASMFGANWSTKALGVCQSCLGIITSKGVSIKDKARQILSQFGLSHDDTNEDMLLDFVNSSEPMSGASPVALWGENLLQDIESIPINNYIDAMTAPFKALGKGLGHLFSGAGKWINKTFKKIQNSTYKSDDFQVVDTKCKNYLYADMGFIFNVTDAASLDPAGRISSDCYTVFPFGYSRLYIKRDYDNNRFNCVIKWCGSFVPDVPVFGSFDTFESRLNEFRTRYAQFYGNSPYKFEYAEDQFQNLFRNTPRDPDSDKEAMFAIIRNKRAFMYAAIKFMYDVMPNDPIFKKTVGAANTGCAVYPFGWLYDWDSLDDTTDVIPDWDAKSLFREYMYRQNLACYSFVNAMHSNVSDFSEPTNASFQQELTHFGQLSSGITLDATMTYSYGNGNTIDRYKHIFYVSGTPPTIGYSTNFNNTSGYADVQYDFLIGLIKSVTKFLNDQNTEYERLSFYPYTTSFNGMEGRYEVKTDQEVADAYSGLLKTAVIIAAVVVISIIAIKVRIKAKRRYQDLSDEIQSKQYHRSEVLGGAEPVPDGMTLEEFKQSSRKELRKLEKKKRRAAKLGGIKIGSDAIENTITALNTKKAEEVAEGICLEDIYEITCGRRTI